MKNRRLSGILLGSSLIVFTATAHAGDVIKANNTVALNVAGAPPTGSWVGGVVPIATDVAVWNSTVTSANSSALGGDAAWAGIRMDASPGGKVTITGSDNTITLGASGILLAGTQQFEIQSRVTLDADQSWTVNNAGNPPLRFQGQNANTLLDLGGFTLDTAGTGAVDYNNAVNLSNGTINVTGGAFQYGSGGSRTATIGSDVTINVGSGKTLLFNLNSGGGGIAVNSSGEFNLNGGTLQVNSTNTTRIEQSGLVSMGNGSNVLVNTGNTNVELTNSAQARFLADIDVAGTATWTETNSGILNTLFSGPLTGSGTLNVRNHTSSRQIDWSGDNSAFTGTVNLDGTTNNRSLRLSSATAGSATATWAVGAGNTLQVNGVAVNLGTLNGAGTVSNSHATNAATVSVGAGTFTGVLSDGGGIGGLGLAKTGSGTLALTGANSYTGLTDIQGGTLTTTTAETGGGAVTVADTATLGLTQLNNGDTFNASTLTMGSAGGSTLELTPAAAPSAALITAGTLTVNGSTTLRVKGLPVAGTTLVSYTTLNGNSGFAGLNLALPFRIGGTLNNTGSAITLATVTDETPKWRNGDGVWDINNTGNWKTSTTATTTNYLEGGAGATDSVIFDDTSSGSSPITVTLSSTVSPVAITVAGNKDYIISGSGEIAGTAGITKNGSAALTLATANTFSGGVQLNEGTLNVNNATALGSGTLSIAGGTVLDNTSGSAVVATNAQNWSGNFTFTGSNDLTLGNAAMTANAAVTVSSGTLSVGGVAGSGFNLTKEGPGTLALGAGSSYSGTTFVNNGVLKASAANAFSSSSAGLVLANVAGVSLDLNGFNQTVTNLQGSGATGGNVILGGGVLTANTTSNVSYGGAITGAGGFTKAGSAILTLTGDKSGYTAATSVTGGTLDLDAINGYFGPAVTVTTGTADNSIVVSGASFVQGNGILNTGISGGAAGFGARGGDLTVNVGGAGALINRNSGGNGGLGQMILGSPTSDSKVIIQNNMGINNFGGTRDITVNPGTGTASGEIAGAITPGAAGGVSGIVKKGTGELILSGLNTYIGNTLVDVGPLTLANGGQLTFKPTANNTSNKISDTTPVLDPAPALNSVTLDGSFVIDLTTTDTTDGNSWTLVDMASVDATHSSSFNVIAFNDDDLDDVWTYNDGTNLWSYTEATGTLSVTAAPVSGFASWITGTFANGAVPGDKQGPNDDPDNDGVSNLVEYAIAGQDPTVANSTIGTFIGNTLSFDKRLPLASDLTYAIETSIDLGATPWAEAPAGIDYINDGTTISYLLPGTNPKDFMRLKVIKNP
jgi:fibronectin-binding autotransporter adhesin